MFNLQIIYSFAGPVVAVSALDFFDTSSVQATSTQNALLDEGLITVLRERFNLAGWIAVIRL